MTRAVLNVKVDPQTKVKAKSVAENMGFSLSALVNAFLTQLVKTKSVQFHVDEVPTPYVQKILKQAQKDYKKGKASPMFDNAKDAIAFLDQQR